MEERSERLRDLGTVEGRDGSPRRALTVARRGYRLGFWIGPAPADAEEACADLHTRLERAEEIWKEFDRPLPPLPRIRAFVEAVLEAFPTDDLAGSPWKCSDIAEDAQADTFTPSIRGPHREVIGLLTQLAHAHGLQAFDLVAHRLLDAGDVMEVDGAPWTTARLGGGLDDLEHVDCRGRRSRASASGCRFPVRTPRRLIPARADPSRRALLPGADSAQLFSRRCPAAPRPVPAG